MNMSESVLVKGRNQETASALLEAAERLGLPPEVVKTSSYGGYLVPQEVFDELGNAPGEDFESKPMESRLQGLGSDEAPVEQPDETPQSFEDGLESDGIATGPGRVAGPVQSAVVEDQGDKADDAKSTKSGTTGRRTASKATQEEKD